MMSGTIHFEDIQAIAGIGKALGRVESISEMSPTTRVEHIMWTAALKAETQLRLALGHIEALGRFADLDLSPDNLRRLADKIEREDEEDAEAMRDMCKHNGVRPGVDFPATM